MSTPRTTEEQLLRNLLSETEKASDERHPGPHPSEESLALFAAGTLAADERKATVQHLADCTECRQVASHLLQLAESSESTTSISNIRSAASTSQRWQLPRALWVALAASLLLAIGLLLGRSGDNVQVAEARTYAEATALLEQSQFNQASELLATSAKGGIESARLRSLRSQAAREIPAVLALARINRLTDFGCDPTARADSITKSIGPDPVELKSHLAALPVSKGAQQARDLLFDKDSGDVELLLNRGHALLSTGELSLAAKDFEAATKLAPTQPLAWIGLGLAQFMGQSYSAAETSFREALRLQPENFAAGMNLAMSLVAQGKTTDALTVWRQQLQLPLSSAESQLAERAIDQLQGDR